MLVIILAFVTLMVLHNGIYPFFAIFIYYFYSFVVSRGHMGKKLQVYFIFIFFILITEIEIEKLLRWLLDVLFTSPCLD